MDQISGGIVLILPFLVFLFSVNMILFRPETLKSELPYNQNVQFYHSIYLLSALAATYSLIKLGCNFFQKNRFKKNDQDDHPTM